MNILLQIILVSWFAILTSKLIYDFLSVFKRKKSHQHILKLFNEQEILNEEKSLASSQEDKDFIELKELILFSEMKELTDDIKKS